MKEPVWPAQLRRTKPRLRVWEVISRAEMPLEVRELCARLEKLGEPMAVSTVYRVLAAFEECGAVTKTTVLGSDSALYALHEPGHEHYAICLGCHHRIPLKHCPIRESDGPEGFCVTDHRVELYGYCAECRKKRENGGKA